MTAKKCTKKCDTRAIALFCLSKLLVCFRIVLRSPSLNLKDPITDSTILPYLFDQPPWALIKFLDLESGRLFKVGAYSRLGAY